MAVRTRKFTAAAVSVTPVMPVEFENADEHRNWLEMYDTPTTPHDCEMDEIEAVRYEHGVDICDSRYL